MAIITIQGLLPILAKKVFLFIVAWYNNFDVAFFYVCSDIKKARLLLKSVTTTNPHHGPGKHGPTELSAASKTIRNI